MFGEIGIVRNEADETSLQILSLFRESISEIRLNEPESVSAYFSPSYSFYIVVHTPLNFKFSEKEKNGTCGFAGMSESPLWNWLQPMPAVLT